MTDSTSTPAAVAASSSDSPAAVAFWQSRIIVMLVVSGLTQLVNVFKLQNLVTPDQVQGLATWILNAVSVGALAVAAHARITLPLPIVTASKAAAAAIAQAKLPGQSGFARVGFLMPLALMLLAGCTLLGLATPQTFSQKYATGVTACTAAITTADTLMKAGKLSPKDAHNIEQQVDTVKDALDIANTVYATDQTTGSNKLAQAVTALTAIQTYLIQAQGTTTP